MRIFTTTTDMAMVQIWEPKPGAEHWTLMIVDKRADTIAVRYYDTLEKESMASRLIAAKVLQEMCPRTPALSLPRRRSCSRQGALACGFTVVWYMEAELIANAIGAGYGCCGWMRESRVRRELHNLGSTMLPCEQRMRREGQAMQDKLQALILVRSDKLKTKDSLDCQREEAFLMALKAAAEFTDGFDMPEPEVKKVTIAEEVGELIEQGIELSLEEKVEPPLPPPPEPSFEPVPPPAKAAKGCKLFQPFDESSK